MHAREILDVEGVEGIPVVARFALEKGDLTFQNYIYVRFGREEERALPAYRAALHAVDRESRAIALAGLQCMGFRIPECVPVILEGLKDPDVRLRRKAAAALVRVARGSSLASQSLLEALEDPDEGVRLLVLAMIAARAPDDRGWIPILANLVRTAEPRVASLAARALGGYGSLAATAVDALVDGLDREVVCANAAEALSEMGESARGAIAHLRKVLASGRRIAPAFEPWVNVLEALDGEEEVCVFQVEDGKVGGEASVLRALRSVGDDFVGIEREIIELCHGSVPAVRHEAAVGISIMAPRLSGELSRVAARALLDMAEGEDLTPSSTGPGVGIVGLALERLGKGAREELSGAVAEGCEARAVVALYAIARMGSERGGPFASEVRAAMADSRPLVRLAALVAMKSIEPAAPAIPELLEACDALEGEWKEEMRRLWARLRAGELGPSRWAVPAVAAAGPLKIYGCEIEGAVGALMSGVRAPRVMLPWLLELAVALCGSEVRESESVLWESLGEEPAPEAVSWGSFEGTRARGGVLREVVSARLLGEYSTQCAALVERARGMAANVPGRVELFAALTDRSEREDAVRVHFAGVLAKLRDWSSQKYPESLMLAACAVRASEPPRELAESLVGRLREANEPLQDLLAGSHDCCGDQVEYDVDLVLSAALRGIESQLARELERILRETPCDQLRRVVLDALGTWPQKDAVTMVAVRTYVDSGDTLIRVLAARAFVGSGGDPEVVLPVLEEALKTRWAARRFRGVDFAGVHVSDAGVWYGSPGIPNYVHHVALRTLGDLGSKARKALPIVRWCLSSPDPVTRVLAVEALWRIEGQVHLNVVIDDLRQWPRWLPNWPTWETGWPFDDCWAVERATEACRVLGELGPIAAEASGILEELAWIPGSIGASARDALSRVGAAREGRQVSR